MQNVEALNFSAQRGRHLQKKIKKNATEEEKRGREEGRDGRGGASFLAVLTILLTGRRTDSVTPLGGGSNRGWEVMRATKDEASCKHPL